MEKKQDVFILLLAINKHSLHLKNITVCWEVCWRKNRSVRRKKISQVNPTQNILFCAYDHTFLHNAYTPSFYMAQPYILMLILKMHNMSSKL